MLKLTPEQLEKLRQIDSPTISNAIEAFNLRPRSHGYVGYDIRCQFPELPTTLGYAITCTADSTTEERPRSRDGWFKLWETLEAAPKPAIVVFKDIGTDRLHSCHVGEVMATIAKRLGAVGFISDGGLRDYNEVQALGIQYFCPGPVVSHGNLVIVDVGPEVEISGLKIKPGDLLHGDLNGVVMIPEEIDVDKLLAQVEAVRTNEAGTMDFVRSQEFTAAKLRQRMTSH